MTVQETSRLAYAQSVHHNLGERQHEVYEAFKSVSHSLTNSEIAEYLNKPINTITPRVFELRSYGLVMEDKKRTCSVTGRTAIAWMLADEEMPEILVI